MLLDEMNLEFYLKEFLENEFIETKILKEKTTIKIKELTINNFKINMNHFESEIRTIEIIKNYKEIFIIKILPTLEIIIEKYPENLFETANEIRYFIANKIIDYCQKEIEKTMEETLFNSYKIPEFTSGTELQKWYAEVIKRRKMIEYKDIAGYIFTYPNKENKEELFENIVNKYINVILFISQIIDPVLIILDEDKNDCIIEDEQEKELLNNIFIKNPFVS